MAPTSPTDPDPPNLPSEPDAARGDAATSGARPPAPTSRRVPGAGGLSLHLLEWSLEGVPLLLIHGFGHHARVWDDLVRALAPYYRVLALDQRGHGDSDCDPAGRYDPETLAADVAAVAEHLGLERLVLVGHSLGGRVAIRFAAAHPERMAGLVVVDAGPELDWRGVLKIRDETARTPETFSSVGDYERLLARALPMAAPEARARLARHGLRRRDDGRFEPKLDPFLRRAVASPPPGSPDPAARPAEPASHPAGPGLGPSDLAARPPEEAPPSSDPAARLRSAEEESRAVWDMLARIPCPTLVVRGAASDVLPPETAERMAEEVLPKGALATVPRAAHAVMLENPIGFTEAVCRFVLDDE